MKNPAISQLVCSSAETDVEGIGDHIEVPELARLQVKNEQEIEQNEGDDDEKELEDVEEMYDNDGVNETNETKLYENEELQGHVIDTNRDMDQDDVVQEANETEFH